jgi:3-oxoadipate enol-lactonase
MNGNTGEKFLRINGVDICYTDSENNIIPLIFIHGFPFDKSMWNPQVDFFKSSFRVITYDIRGVGKSANSGMAGMTIYADDLAAIIEELDLKKAVVCGLSMGGYILLNAVNRFPEKFEALILADTQCVADTPEGIEKRKNTIRQIEENGLDDFAKSFVGNVFSKESLINKIEAVENIQNVILSATPGTVTGTLNALAQRSETCSVLDKIKIPSLILCGREDIVTPVKQSEFMHANIKGSKLGIIDNAGHLSNLEQPVAFNKLIFDFVRDLRIRGSL